MKLRLILLAVALPVIGGLTACQKDKKDKSVYHASQEAAQVGVMASYSECTDSYFDNGLWNRVQVSGSCLVHIDISGVGPTDHEIKIAINALRKLNGSISADQGNILKRDSARDLVAGAISILQTRRLELITGKKVN